MIRLHTQHLSLQSQLEYAWPWSMRRNDGWIQFFASST